MNDYYLETRELEDFLSGVLNQNQRSKTLSDLKGAYQAIKLNEKSRLLTPAECREIVGRVLKYFSKAIDVLIKRNPEMKSRGENLKSQIEHMKSPDDIWYLYEEVRKMK
ncbi:hypothetical protein GCM10011506_40340 [Marivirga lumbricoides]|uniref:Uncharacterized protein n=1 Tax=Marivirga lumbricoides TaxID=1046115 RepID=A0ABQ1N0C7_9BACT|nr:hypothetical protein GCM10011506_40240 [Marivirga lumbricoides]GGC50591.1 hypothetical protein GCM10011506_40340 [Marivirga lumbricoides]